MPKDNVTTVEPTSENTGEATNETSATQPSSGDGTSNDYESTTQGSADQAQVTDTTTESELTSQEADPTTQRPDVTLRETYSSTQENEITVTEDQAQQQTTLNYEDQMKMLRYYKDKLEQDISSVEDKLDAIDTVPTVMDTLLSAIVSRRKRRSAAFNLGSDNGNGIITVEPYCNINANDSLTNDPSSVLVAIISDINTTIKSGTTDQIVCMNDLITAFTDAIKKGEVSITVSSKVTITELANSVKNTAKAESETLNSVLDSLLQELEEVTQQLENLESERGVPVEQPVQPYWPSPNQNEH
ncbi:hypothetical protein SK128_001060 [Halocaridina rubra]|uniref:Uncharacterized protein n=1 Tax=Halocaridina rubra TaxID=373956 RepID=A0AAN8WS35_HALRR